MEKSTCIVYLVLCIVLILIIIFKIKSKDNFDSDIHFHDVITITAEPNVLAATNNQKN